ncbi:chromatin-remodeling ATPase CHD1 [Aspergillus clavatus NRRL 1]|uniref:Chromodomain helicase (Chd1), putative n=1 Tax=Aspergillus clavatus (strain ATCC 1007 / CBS 513.65 / DSM 816 / NCTC 3887 / NRRL 1 / QM 1276 / 107) TaxID=344612 RepID=A1CQ87_ASPCL|nr:chromodomain helicase (Chd1), putative [Aspergillus clavatus NRRL 1]EAW07808.1 chromodomain helicase (Chd1), putative [Aspergillus clavatus NRRL 1]
MALSNGFSSSLASHTAAINGEHSTDHGGLDMPDQSHNFTSSESSPEADAGDESYAGGSPHADAVEDGFASHHSESDSSSSSAENSSPREINRGLKRKSSSISESDFMRQNPDLYGLRRSGRARTTRQVVQSGSSDSESDAVVSRAKRRRPVASQRSSKQLSPSPVQSSYSEESESDEYGGPSRTSKAKRRRLLQAALNQEPSHAEVRFSTRNASRVSNYNEDDDDSMFEDEADEDVTENYWVNNVEDTRPAVDVVLNHRPKADVNPGDPDVGRHSFEFYIKWQGKSHYHATWETYESLLNCRSTRRVDNYVRKVLSEELRMNHDEDAMPEEREKWNLDRERDVDAIEDYKQVERVIATRDGDEGTEYLVKWKRLFYDSCTWESESLVSEIAQREIDRFLDRSSHPPLSDKNEMNPATRKPFEPIKGTPTFLQNGELKDFQVKGVNFMAFNWVKNRNVVLADEMGLGKTVQTVAFIAWLRHVRRQQGPFIVVVPLSTMPSWAETFDNWSPDLNYIVYNGNEAARNMLKDHELMIDGNPRRSRFNVLLTTYEYVLQDAAFLSQFKWQFMAVDEAHRLKNRDSQLYQKLLEFKSPARLLITGTPIQNNLAELAALMDFLNPGVIDVDVDMDLNAEAASQKLAELTNAIQPYMLRRTKSKVESDLPPKTEKIIRVELSDVQLEYYKNILTKNYAALNDGAKGQKQSLLNIMMELKKASNHPFMFPNAEARILEGSTRREDILRALITSSGKMMLLDQLLAKLKRDGHRVLIFSQMVKMLDLLGDYMESRGYTYQRLDGTIPAVSRRLAIEHFNAPDSSDFCFLLSTRAGGLGINLMTADTVVLFDSDWNPQADLQAMARAHRIGQTRPVSVYRLVSKDTVEEEVIERARNKLLLEFITIQRGVTDKEASELQSKMARSGAFAAEPNSTEDISRILKRRGQKMFEQTGNQQKLEQIDIDSVLANAELHQTEQAEGIQADGGEEFLKAFDFVDIKVDDLSWDDIIPKDQLEEIKAEEKRKADDLYLAEQIEMSRGRKRTAPGDGQNSREERKAKRQARAQVAVDDGEESDESHHLDPKRPLLEKEYRHLLRAFLRYGDIDDREEDVIREARLLDRDRETVRTALREITEKAAKLVREDIAKMEALENAGKMPTKKEKKAVLFDHHGVKRLNAYTIMERPNEMRILREATTAVPDFKNFRIPEATKAADYSCQWGAREDGMLCIGIARHGYGAWTQIRDDPDLGLGDKFFLEEHRVERKNERLTTEDKTTKSPGAVHLVRRADYLLSVLKDKVTNGTNLTAKKAVENHHRNNRKNARGHASASVSASPAPSIPRKGHRETDRSRHRSQTHGIRHSVERTHTPSRDTRPKSSHENNGPSRHRLSDASSDGVRRRKPSDTSNADEMSRLFFRPIREQLKRVAGVTKENFPNKSRRASELGRLLAIIGSFIIKTLHGENYMASLELRLWDYVATNYWPNHDAGGKQLHAMYQKLAAREAAAKKKAAAEPSPFSIRE